MPRLVLYDDDGSTLFAGDVSQKNVQIVARFLQRNMGALRVAAEVKRSFDQLLELGDVLAGKRRPASIGQRAAPPAAPRGRGARRR
jgi:hypothetical protein